MKTLKEIVNLQPRPTVPNIPLAVLLSMVVLMLAACTSAARAPVPTPTIAPTPTPTPTPRPVIPKVDLPRSVQLPADEGAHGAPIEWWYFNGHLTDESGRNYSYHFVTFQTATPAGYTPRLLQASLADHAQRLHWTDERVALAAEGGVPGHFDFQISGWQMYGDGVNYGLVFDAAGYLVDLRAISLKPAALHDEVGLVKMGHAGESYYYSHTRLDTKGTMTVNGERRTVVGVSWMDHQWGDFSPIRVGWQWASLQLDDDSELMLYLLQDAATGQLVDTYGTYIAPDASMRKLGNSDIAFAATGSWTSPATGAMYPMGWELSISSLAVKLTLTPVQEEAEFAGSKYVPAAYWEGAVMVMGNKDGAVVSGKGFVELVGYDRRQTSYPTSQAGQ